MWNDAFLYIKSRRAETERERRTLALASILAQTKSSVRDNLAACSEKPDEISDSLSQFIQSEGRILPVPSHRITILSFTMNPAMYETKPDAVTGHSFTVI